MHQHMEAKVGIQVSWDTDSHAAIRFEIDNRWTWEDWEQAQRTVTEMVEPLDYMVKVFVTTTRSFSPPQNFISKSLSESNRRNPKVDEYVVIGAPSFAKILISAINKMLTNVPP